MISHSFAQPRPRAGGARAVGAWTPPTLFRVFAVVLFALSLLALPVTAGLSPAANAQPTAASGPSPSNGAQPNPDDIDIGKLDADVVDHVCKRDGDDPLPDDECKKKLIDKYGDRFGDSACTGKDANGCVEKLAKEEIDEEEKSKREQSEAPEEDYSLYRLSSANTALLFDAIGLSTDTDTSAADGDNEDTDNAPSVDTEKASGLSSDWAEWMRRPANAGAFVGICDSDATPGAATCSRFYGDDQTKFTKGYDYNTFKNYPVQDNAGAQAARGVYEYSQFGALLSNMGFLDTVTDQRDAQRIFMGNLMLMGFLFAGSIDAFFSLVLDALILLNPFRLFFDAVRENSNTGYDVADQRASGPMTGLANFVNTLYSGLVSMSWMATIPIFIGLFVMGALMLRRYDKGGNFKKLAVRITFIAVGFALLGSTYTAALDSFKGAEGNSNDVNANRVVLTTYVDYDAWVMNRRLALHPRGTFEWNEDKHTISGKTAVHLRDTARLTNMYVDPAYASDKNSDVGNENGLNYAENVFTRAGESRTAGNGPGSGFKQFDAVWSMLNRYINGDSVTSVAFEQRVKATYKRLAVENGAAGDVALEKLFTSYTDPVVMKKMSPEDIAAYAVAFVAPGDGLQVQGVNDANEQSGGTPTGAAGRPGSGTSVLRYSTADSRTANGACTADNVGGFVADDGGKFVPSSDGCNLSPLTMYNFLNTKFYDKNMTVQSSRKADSGYVMTSHASVSQVGNGVMGLLYWFSSLSILVSFALIGIFYALAMLFSNIKRSIQLIAAVPFATLGFMGGIAKVIIYTIAMIVEIILTLFVYRVIQEFLLAIPAVLEAPLVAAFNGEDTTANAAAFGGAIAAFTAMLADNAKVTTLVVTLVSTGGIIIFTMIALKLRNSIVSAIDEAVTNTVNRLLDTSVGSASGGARGAVGRQLMTAGALAAGHRIATGGQADDALEGAATGAGATGGDDGTDGNGGNGGGGNDGPTGPDDGGVSNASFQRDEDGRFVQSSVNGGGTVLLSADGESDAFSADPASYESPNAAYSQTAEGDGEGISNASYLDENGNAVDMTAGPAATEDGGFVAPDGTPLSVDENGNYVDADGNVMYDADGKPAGDLAASLASADGTQATGDVQGVSDTELAARVDKQGGLSNASKLAAATSAAGLGAAALANMGGAEAAAGIHASGELAEAATVGSTASALAADGGVEVGGDGSGLYQMNDGSVSIASDSALGEAMGGEGTVTQSPFTGEALAAAGGNELVDGSGVYSMPGGETVAAADSALAQANSDFTANTVDDALEHSGGAVGMSNMTSSELAAAGGTEIAPGTGMYQMDNGAVMAASDSAVATQHAMSGETAGTALVSDMSASQIAASGGEQIGDSGIYQMPDGSAVVPADSPMADNAAAMGVGQEVAASGMTGEQLTADGAQEIGSTGVYAQSDGQLVAASDGAARGGAEAISFGTTDGRQVADAVRNSAAGMQMPDADSGARGGFAAVSNAMQAAPGAMARMKDTAMSNETIAALAGSGAAGAGLGAALSRQAAVNRANGMAPAEAMLAAQQQVRSGQVAQDGVVTDGGQAVPGQAGQTGEGGRGGSTQVTPAAQQTTQQQGGQSQDGQPAQAASPRAQGSGVNPLMYPLITTAVRAATSPGPVSNSMHDSATGGQKNRRPQQPPQSGSMFSGMTRPLTMGMMTGNAQQSRGGNQQSQPNARDAARARSERERSRDRARDERGREQTPSHGNGRSGDEMLRNGRDGATRGVATGEESRDSAATGTSQSRGMTRDV